jgi:hypothetical protein
MWDVFIKKVEMIYKIDVNIQILIYII